MDIYPLIGVLFLFYNDLTEGSTFEPPPHVLHLLDYKSYFMRTPYDEVRISIRVEYPILVRVRAHRRRFRGKVVRVKAYYRRYRGI